jgi:hypothetical protein
MPRIEDDAASRRRSAFELLLGLAILGVILAGSSAQSSA